MKAEDLLSTYYGNYGLPQTLSFAWDRTQGVNGEKLHLTITVMTAFPLIGGGHAFMITSTKGGRADGVARARGRAVAARRGAVTAPSAAPRRC